MEVILAWTLAELISPLAELISPLAELIPALAELIPAAWDVCSIPLCRAGALSGLGASGLDSAVDHLRTVLSSTRVGNHVSLAIRTASHGHVSVDMHCLYRAVIVIISAPPTPLYYERGWVGGVVL